MTNKSGWNSVVSQLGNHYALKKMLESAAIAYNSECDKYVFTFHFWKQFPQPGTLRSVMCHLERVRTAHNVILQMLLDHDNRGEIMELMGMKDMTSLPMPTNCSQGDYAHD